MLDKGQNNSEKNAVIADEAAQKKAFTLKAASAEMFNSEKSFRASIKMLVEALSDENVLRAFSAGERSIITEIASTYKKLLAANPLGVTPIEDIDKSVEKISQAFNPENNDFKAMYDSFAKIISIYPRIIAFEAHLSKNNITALDRINKKLDPANFLSLAVMAIQRYPRYPLTLKEMEENATSEPFKTKIQKVRETVIKLGEPLNNTPQEETDSQLFPIYLAKFKARIDDIIDQGEANPSKYHGEAFDKFAERVKLAANIIYNPSSTTKDKLSAAREIKQTVLEVNANKKLYALLANNDRNFKEELQLLKKYRRVMRDKLKHSPLKKMEEMLNKLDQGCKKHTKHYSGSLFNPTGNPLASVHRVLVHMAGELHDTSLSDKARVNMLQDLLYSLESKTAIAVSVHELLSEPIKEVQAELNKLAAELNVELKPRAYGDVISDKYFVLKTIIDSVVLAQHHDVGLKQNTAAILNHSLDANIDLKTSHVELKNLATEFEIKRKQLVAEGESLTKETNKEKKRIFFKNPRKIADLERKYDENRTVLFALLDDIKIVRDKIAAVEREAQVAALNSANTSAAAKLGEGMRKSLGAKVDIASVSAPVVTKTTVIKSELETARDNILKESAAIYASKQMPEREALLTLKASVETIKAMLKSKLSTKEFEAKSKELRPLEKFIANEEIRLQVAKGEKATVAASDDKHAPTSGTTH